MDWSVMWNLRHLRRRTGGNKKMRRKRLPLATSNNAGATSDPIGNLVSTVLPGLLPSAIPEIPELPGLPGAPEIPEIPLVPGVSEVP